MPYTLSRSFFLSLIGCAVMASPAFASDHPHNKDSKKVVKETDIDIDRYFDKHAKELREAIDGAKSESRIIIKRMERRDKHDKAAHNNDAPKKSSQSRRIDIIEDPDALRDTAKDIQNMLAESGLLESLADMVISLADDIEITETGDGMSLSFDGKKIGSFEQDGDDSLSIESFGKSTRIEKEVFMENGKKKTRIVIETDADSDVEYDIVPKTREK